MESIFTAFDHVEFPLMCLDLNGRLRYANRACRERFHIAVGTAFPIGSDARGMFHADITNHHGQTLHSLWSYRVAGEWVVCTFRHTEEKQSTITFYETLIRAMGEGVIMHDHTGEIVLANESAQRILSLSAEQIRGRTPIDQRWHTIHEDGRPFPGEEHPAMVTLRTGEPQHNIIMGVHKPDGELNWISINSEPVMLGDGGVLVSFADITPLKEMQLALQHSEKRYRSMFEEHSAVMLLIDPNDGRIVDANNAACTFYGYSRADLLKKYIHSINALPPEQVSRQMRAAVDYNLNHFRFVHRLADGEARHVEVYSVGLEVEGETLLYSIIHDVTARFLTEKALRLSEERFRRVAETAQDAIVTTTVDGTILYWNQAAERMFGYTDSQAIGSHIDIIMPPNYERLHQQRLKAYASRPKDRRASHVIEVEGQHKSGRVLPIEVSLAGWNIDQTHYLTAIIRDLTNRRLAERQRIELAIERQKTEVLTSFIRDASHEFRSPLSIIMTNIFLLDRITDEEKRTTKKEQIRNAVRELSHLLEGIIELVELEHFTMTGVQTININALVRSVMVDLQQLAKRKAHTINVTLPDTPPTVEGREAKVFHAVYHLVHNALRFTPEGGTITITVETRDDTVRLTVRDDGPGMSDETQAHMFDRFWRYDKAHTTAGFGLGLPVAQRVVELHHGSIIYESTLGEGSTFTIVLPRTQPATESDSA